MVYVFCYLWKERGGDGGSIRAGYPKCRGSWGKGLFFLINCVGIKYNTTADSFTFVTAVNSVTVFRGWHNLYNIQ